MSHLIRHAPRAVLVLAMLVGAVFLPGTADADTKSQRAEVQRKRAAVASEVDALRASDAQVEAALRVLESNVRSQTAALRDAERRSAEADAALEAATAEVQRKEAQIDALDTAVKELAVAAYIRPPSQDSLADSLSSANIGEAELKQSLLEAKSSNQLDVLDQLERAREDLETARARAEQAAVVAENNRASVASKLDQLTEAKNQQAKVVADVQARLDHRLGELAGLQELDAQLGKKIAAEVAAEQKRLAALASQRPAGGGTVSITGSGSIVSVRGIRVHESIADELAAMLSAADADGIYLSGGGYRDPSGQIAVRRSNCGTSNYAVYQMPASQCSPPTARPGTSMHERGLAIDFTYNGRVISSRSSPAYQWLAGNAARYGFYNLPSEPWHWSVNGR